MFKKTVPYIIGVLFMLCGVAYAVDDGAGNNVFTGIFHVEQVVTEEPFTHWIGIYEFTNEYASYNTTTFYVHPTTPGDRIRAPFDVPQGAFGSTTHVDQITIKGRTNDDNADFDWSLISSDLDNSITFDHSKTDIWNGVNGVELSADMLAGGEDFDMGGTPYVLSLNINNTTADTDVWFYGIEVTYHYVE